MLRMLTILASTGWFCILIACSSESELSPFSSDGCSLFPNSSLITEDDWCVCCFEHDIAYWQGGTKHEREKADVKLKQCVLDKTNNQVLANIMYEGVRFGGSPYFYNWYRWGYGWPVDRKYQALTSQEKKQVKSLLAVYFSSAEQSVCVGERDYTSREMK